MTGIDDTSETTVVYVAGYGRSGSTLLDLLLGQREAWFSMGEFRMFWHALRDGWRCGCGDPVARCRVWSEVVEGSRPLDVSSVIADARATLRIRHVPALAMHVRGGLDPAALDRLRETLARVYRVTAETAGARILVDSSKDPIYGLVLAGAPGIHMHVVHLVRDSRAVAWSWQRTRVRPEIESGRAYMPTRSATRTSLDWDLRNGLVHVLARRARSYTRVTYEELTADPERIVDGVARRLGWHANPPPSVPVAVANHTVAGNPMRFTPGGITVDPDVEWCDRLDGRSRRLVTALTWPLLRAYDYR